MTIRVNGNFSFGVPSYSVHTVAILDRNFSFWAGQLRTINVDLAISLVPKKFKYVQGSTHQIESFIAVRGSSSMFDSIELLFDNYL